MLGDVGVVLKGGNMDMDRGPLGLWDERKIISP